MRPTRRGNRRIYVCFRSPTVVLATLLLRRLPPSLPPPPAANNGRVTRGKANTGTIVETACLRLGWGYE
jgi:hypothetical protein